MLAFPLLLQESRKEKMFRSKWLVFCVAILLPQIANAQTLKLQDVPLGKSAQIGSFDYVKVAHNAFMQSNEVTCPDGSTVGGLYVKCFKTKEDADATCCTTTCPPNSAYDATKGKCVCDEGYTFNNHFSTCIADDYGVERCEAYYRAGELAMYKICSGIVNSSIDFDYTGTVQSFQAPVSGTYLLEVWGAQGGDGFYPLNSLSNEKSVGGKGGYSYGEILLSSNKSLYIYVGGQGNSIYNPDASIAVYGGWNGGGDNFDTRTDAYRSSGGGSTDISIEYSLAWNSKNHLNSRIIVAGGGGGASWGSSYGAEHGGAGGGVSGLKPTKNTNSQTAAQWSESHHNEKDPDGGTQTSGGNSYVANRSGSFGTGGSIEIYNNEMGGPGGGGYYGGGAAGGHNCGGAGGSGYIGGVTNGKTIAGNQSFPSPSGGTETGHSGNGYARITLISVD